MLGLVLTAGGARGAYQAGVLKRIGELRALRKKASPFQIVTGASAGAINGAMIAALSGSFREATDKLAQLWSELTVRYLMDGLGTPDAQSADLMSYLLFDATYTRQLIDIGYRDAAARINEIEAFLLGDASAAATSRLVSLLKPRGQPMASPSAAGQDRT